MQFGLYLKHKGRLTADELVKAIEIQHQELVKIGQLAIERRVLSPREVFLVLHKQSDIPHDRFGETAIELGLMTSGDLSLLLAEQSTRKRPLVDILIQEGILSQEEAHQELAAFRLEQLQGSQATRRQVGRRLAPGPLYRTLYALGKQTDASQAESSPLAAS